MREVVIVSAVRTPIGNFGGALSKVDAVALGVISAKEVIKRAKIDPSIIDEVIIGNVLGAGLGQNVARQVAINAGVPEAVPAFTVGKVCGSGLRAVSIAAQFIKAGDADVILCGGTENMSQSPYILPTGRWGQRMGNGQTVDIMVNDGLTDAFYNYHMGITAENVAKKWSLTREMQDAFACQSQNRAEAAQKAGRFNDEIVPVQVPQRKGDPIIVDADEFPKHGSTTEKLAKLRPAFDKEGTVTAGNASGINDGSAMLIVMSKEKAESLGIEYMAEIKGYASVGVDPQIMGVGPIPSAQKALDKAKWDVSDLDLIEANEAFASQSLAVVKELGLNTDIVNVNGGAIALGHPIGCSGARILTTLLHEMTKRDSKKGLATLCIGGGMGTALLVERK